MTGKSDKISRDGPGKFFPDRFLKSGGKRDEENRHLTTSSKDDTVSKDEKAVKRKSILDFLKKRENGWCEFLRKRGEGAFELRSGNALPVPAVTGTEVRVNQTRIQVEPRTFCSP